MISPKQKDFIKLAIIFLLITVLKLTTFFPQSFLLAEYLTQAKVERMGNLLSKADVLPDTLTKLAEMKPLSMSQYDFWGQRLSYTKLQQKAFVISSHSYDNRKDLWFSNTETFQTDNKFFFKKERVFFTGQVLEGISSPDMTYYSKLYQNVKNSNLIVYQKLDNNLFISSHRNIKEFVWLDNHKIVYTTNKSVKYSSSAFIWDLQKDETYNLSEKIKSKINLDESNDLCISLSKNPKDKVIITSQACQKITTFSNFFSAKNQFAIEISGDYYNLKPLSKFRPVDLMLSNFLHSSSNPNRTQKAFQKLKVEGQIQSTLESWQLFAEENSESPLFPYCVFIISQLYQSAAQEVNKDEAQELLALSRELAWGISKSPKTPDYIKVFSQNSYNESELYLTEGHSIGSLRL